MGNVLANHQRFREERNRRSLTLESLAGGSAISTTSIGRFERGKTRAIRTANLEALVTAMNDLSPKDFPILTIWDFVDWRAVRSDRCWPAGLAPSTDFHSIERDFGLSLRDTAADRISSLNLWPELESVLRQAVVAGVSAVLQNNRNVIDNERRTLLAKAAPTIHGKNPIRPDDVVATTAQLRVLHAQISSIAQKLRTGFLYLLEGEVTPEYRSWLAREVPGVESKVVGRAAFCEGMKPAGSIGVVLDGLDGAELQRIGLDDWISSACLMIDGQSRLTAVCDPKFRVTIGSLPGPLIAPLAGSKLERLELTTGITSDLKARAYRKQWSSLASEHVAAHVPRSEASEAQRIIGKMGVLFSNAGTLHLRNAGAAAILKTAECSFCAFVHPASGPHDWIAAQPLILAMGGKVTSISGQPLSLSHDKTSILAAATPEFHHQLSKILLFGEHWLP